MIITQFNQCRKESSVPEGVVTLADKTHFYGLILLSKSIKRSYDVPICCFDAGLTESQRGHLPTLAPNVIVTPIPHSNPFPLLRAQLSRTIDRDRDEWLLWACPFLIAQSPFRRTLWLDCDLIVLRNLRRLFALLDHGPVLTPSDNKFGLTPNHSALYKMLPLSGQMAANPEPLLNAGVIGFDLERDRDLLQRYMYPVLQATCDKSIRSHISWHDQGSLIWAVRSLGLQERVVDIAWNYPVRALEGTAAGRKLLEYDWHHDVICTIATDFPDINILHWNGQARKLHHVLCNLTKATPLHNGVR